MVTCGRGVRRRESGVVRRPGPGDGFGRADRLAGADRAAGPVEEVPGRFGWGEPGREAVSDDRRDGGRRGLHRRSGPDPLWWDAPVVRRGLRPGHAGSAAARVHPRPHPAAGLGAAGSSGQPGHRDGSAARARRAGVHRCGLAAAADLRPRQTRRQLRPHQARRQAGAPQGPVTAGGHDLHPDRCPGDRRDPAPRRSGQLRQRGSVDGHRRGPHRPPGRRQR
jgi:hypothetical protein